MGSDAAICNAARVSTNNLSSDHDKDAGLIRYLMSNKHGSPFEHGAMSFYIECPIFVAREYFRHRIGFSYNEMSGRYTELEPVFYVPSSERPFVNVGTSARPVMQPGNSEDYAILVDNLKESYCAAWDAYQDNLANNIAKELARICLPVGIYTKFHVTCNPRSMMNFLSLRTHDEDAAHVSNPQYEIELVARQMERYFAYAWPLTYSAFNLAKRVAP